MTRYILERIGFALLTLFLISLVSYVLMAAFSQENPFLTYAQSKNISPVADYVKAQEIKYGWNLPIIVRFFKYLGGIFKGDWGAIYNPDIATKLGMENSTIPKLFFVPLVYSIRISLPAFFISAIIGIGLGTLSGYKRGTLTDSIINTFVLIFIALPSFIIAPLAINLAVKLGLPSRVFLEKDGFSQSRQILSYLTPIIIVILGSLATYTSYTRNQIITVLTSNHVLIAKTKGLSNWQIFWKHVLRNISIPLFSIIFPSYIGLLTGSIVIETYWSVPGTSQVIINSFPKGEINIVMFNIVFFTFLSVFTEIIVDVSYVVLDPRIKYASASKYNYLGYLKSWNERRRIFKSMQLEISEGGQSESGRV
ncbi:ABC transporter permease [Mycoplasma sp. 4044]